MTYTTLNGSRNLINGNLSNLNSLSISYDQKLKGTISSTSNESGIYIFRSGATIGNLNGSSSSIILEGGNPDWLGQVNPTEIFDNGSVAQSTMLKNILNYILKLNPNTLVMDNR